MVPAYISLIDIDCECTRVSISPTSTIMIRKQSIVSFGSIKVTEDEVVGVENVLSKPNSRKALSNKRRKAEILRVKEAKKEIMQDGEKWADDIINMFIAPNAKRHIDNEVGLLTNEESEFRLIMLLVALALMLGLLASYFCLTAIQISAPNIIIKEWNTEISRSPHVFIIYQDGLYLDYSTDENISPSKNFTFYLHKSVTKYESGSLGVVASEFSSYMAYADTENIYIFYGNGERDATYINFHTRQLRTMPGSKLTSKSNLGSGVRAGNLFLVAGDKSNHMTADHTYQVNTQLWSDRKKTMIQAPTLKATAYTENCLTSFNK